MKKLSFLLFAAAVSLHVQAQTVKKTATTSKSATTANKTVVPAKKTTTTVTKTPTSTTTAKQQGSFEKNTVKVAADKSAKVKITTDSGVIMVKLYDSTPLHRDNFVKLVQQHFFDSLLFHRVIPEFMIQGGDPLSKNAVAGSMLGNGGSDMMRIPAEFRKGLIHKKGVLSAARDGNLEKASSACQFYIVEGRKFSDAELTQIEQGSGIKYTPAEREMYKTIGGTPFLDNNYTVFGEVVSGLEVIGKISHVSADAANRPVGDIRMKIELVK